MKYGKVSMSFIWWRGVGGECICMWIVCGLTHNKSFEFIVYYIKEIVDTIRMRTVISEHLSTPSYEPNMFRTIPIVNRFLFSTLFRIFAICNNFRNDFQRFWCMYIYYIRSIQNEESQWPFVLTKACSGFQIEYHTRFVPFFMYHIIKALALLSSLPSS